MSPVDCVKPGFWCLGFSLTADLVIQHKEKGHIFYRQKTSEIMKISPLSLSLSRAKPEPQGSLSEAS